jgi:hypothetical protein
VLAVQVRSRGEADEELTAVGARAAVGHGQDTGASVLERAVELVLELAAPDGLSTTTGTSGVTALQHEAGDDAVEDDAVVLASVGETCKVLTCLLRSVLDLLTSGRDRELTLGVLSLYRAMVMLP